MSKSIVNNKKAYHFYTIFDKFEAGLSLQGTEVKSLRLSKVNISEAYCQISPDLQLTVHQLHINVYAFGNQFNHNPDRVRVLLMHKSQIRRLYNQVREKGYTLVPLRLYFNQRNRIKIEIALAKGKKLHDKREALKEKDDKKSMKEDGL